MQNTGKKTDYIIWYMLAALKEVIGLIGQIDRYLVSLSSKTYVFEDEMTKYWLV